MGRAACATTGNRYAVSYHSFPSSSERDAWCEDGGDFTSSAGWRESVKASDSELRSYIYAHNHTPDSSGGFYRTNPFSTDGKPNR